jgi:hypothetical protein
MEEEDASDLEINSKELSPNNANSPDDLKKGDSSVNN